MRIFCVRLHIYSQYDINIFNTNKTNMLLLFTDYRDEFKAVFWLFLLEVFKLQQSLIQDWTVHVNDFAYTNKMSKQALT